LYLSAGKYILDAFDCVNHTILLAKLHFCGIWGIMEDWFRSYLTNRRQRVEIKSPNPIKNFFSDWAKLKHGLPQGSILGPLLFIIHDDQKTLCT
jgi:hypothetical protein